jgi:hypothetical protein
LKSTTFLKHNTWFWSIHFWMHNLFKSVLLDSIKFTVFFFQMYETNFSLNTISFAENIEHKVEVCSLNYSEFSVILTECNSNLFQMWRHYKVQPVSSSKSHSMYILEIKATGYDYDPMHSTVFLELNTNNPTIHIFEIWNTKIESYFET